MPRKKAIRLIFVPRTILVMCWLELRVIFIANRLNSLSCCLFVQFLCSFISLLILLFCSQPNHKSQRQITNRTTTLDSSSLCSLLSQNNQTTNSTLLSSSLLFDRLLELGLDLVTLLDHLEILLSQFFFVCGTTTLQLGSELDTALNQLVSSLLHNDLKE